MQYLGGNVMRYTKITSAEELRKKYDVLIGWGA